MTVKRTPFTNHWHICFSRASIVFSFALILAAWSPQIAVADDPSVIVAPVKKEQVSPQLQYVGRIQPLAQVELKARVEGYLQKPQFKEGADVKKGQTLINIDPAAYEIVVQQRQADVEAAQATLTNATTTLKRDEVLLKKGTISESTYDTAQANERVAAAQLEQAKAALDAAKLNLSYTHIVSPIDGKTSLLTVTEGNLVGNDQTLLTVTSLDPIYVYIYVSENARMDARQKGVELNNPKFQLGLRLPDGTEYKERGIFDYIDTSISTETDTVLVRAKFPNPDRVLLPGGFVHAYVVSKDERYAEMIPQSAVQKDQKGFFVLVVDKDNKVEKRSVELGEQQAGNWVVKSGLKEGERVIVSGLQKVQPGVTVKPSER
ncbi:efflux RND transporter periplasmic adaptor subunit [Ruegeria sp. ANG-R]|uniref:efflux RND transporter periplasmic adaptor subunit n=1 Tax=Ruegeria sp. ANG-R TaxID=1577903 RepID=UPI000A4C7E26|nr:efflux RND transporter periplasmic adaptor subunit [Ruegeria sp. ANG-R]